MRKYPKHPEMMARRVERMQKLSPMLCRIHPILVMECKVTLKAYYGSYWRAGWVLILESIVFGSHSLYWHFVYWIADLVGWTECIPMMPGDNRTVRRHKKGCSPNCQNPDCMDGAIPKWYLKLTGASKFDV
jgi:hypothetical protein